MQQGIFLVRIAELLGETIVDGPAVGRTIYGKWRFTICCLVWEPARVCGRDEVRTVRSLK